jgi:hypothetical protein
VEIASPPSGPYLLVEELCSGDRLLRSGASSPARRLFGAIGRGEVLPTYAEADLVLEAPAPPGWGPRKVGRFELPALSALSDSRVNSVTGHQRCSPLQVLEDGVPLPEGHASTVEQVSSGPGRFRHDPTGLVFSSSDGRPPAQNPERYRLALNPDRRCGGSAWWVYPGDEVRFLLDPDAISALPAGADTLELSGHPLGEGTGMLTVHADADGTRVMEERVEVASLAGASARMALPLPHPLPAELEVRLLLDRAAPFLLLSSLSIERSALCDGAAAPAAASAAVDSP